MTEVLFTSRLGRAHRDELERLLFFNENQARVSASVEFVARTYGIPRVNVVGDDLTVEVGSETSTQTLFVVRSIDGGVDPIGVVVYTRDANTLVVLFVAVHEAYSSRGHRAGSAVLVRIVAELKSIAARVRGIDRLLLYVGRREPTTMKIRRDSPAPPTKPPRSG